MKKNLFKTGGLILSLSAFLFASCAGAAGGASNEPKTNGTNGLTNTVWLYDKSEYKTTRPPKPEPENPKPDPETPNPDPDPNPNPEPEKPKPEKPVEPPEFTWHTTTKDYVYFAPDDYVYKGTVKWTDKIDRNGNIVEHGNKSITPQYAGTYKSEFKVQISFHFTYELVTTDVWGNIPQYYAGKLTHTPDRIYNDYCPLTDIGLYSSAITISHNSSNLELVSRLRDGEYAASITYYWNKDPYGLDKQKLCSKGTTAKFEPINLDPAVFTTKPDAEGKCDFISFEKEKRVGYGTLLANNGELFGEYKNSYSIDTVKQLNTYYFQYDSSIYTTSGNKVYSLKKDLQNNKITISGEGKEYTKLSSPRIYATKDEQDMFSYKNPEKTGGGGSIYPYMAGNNARYSYEATQLSEMVKDYPNKKPGYSDVIVDKYNSTKDWCYQYANFDGYNNGNKEILVKYTVSTYNIVNLLTGKESLVSKLLPGRFEADNKWVSVSKNPTATAEGANIVDITMDGKKYTLCFANVPIAKTSIANNEDAKLISLSIAPSRNKDLKTPIFADINQTDKTITIDLPENWDASNVMFYYEVSEDSRTGKACKLFYSTNENDTVMNNFTEIISGYRDLGIYVGCFKKDKYSDETQMYYATNSEDKPNKISAVRILNHYKENVIPMDDNMKYTVTEFAHGNPMTPEQFINDFVESNDGRAEYKNKSGYYLVAPGIQELKDNGYLTWEAYQYLREVYLASTNLQPDGKTPLGKTFTLLDYVTKRPTNFVWKRPAKGRAIQFEEAGYVPADGLDNRTGYDLTKMKTLMTKCYIDFGKEYHNIYKVILK